MFILLILLVIDFIEMIHSQTKPQGFHGFYYCIIITTVNGENVIEN